MKRNSLTNIFRRWKNYILPSPIGEGLGVRLLLLTCLLTSCGEFWELETKDVGEKGTMTLQRKIVSIVVGDGYKVPVTITPSELATNAVFWLSENNDVAFIRNDSIIGQSEGIARVVAFSTLSQLRDTCYAYVMPSMEVLTGTYPYDMVIYANVTVHGKKLTAETAKDISVVAFVGEQVRGIGQMRKHKDKEYMELRVWGPAPSSDEEVAIRCYFKKEAKLEVFDVDLTFDGEQHGTLSKPLELVLDEKSKEYVPVIEEDDEEFQGEQEDQFKVVDDGEDDE